MLNVTKQETNEDDGEVVTVSLSLTKYKLDRETNTPLWPSGEEIEKKVAKALGWQGAQIIGITQTDDSGLHMEATVARMYE